MDNNHIKSVAKANGLKSKFLIEQDHFYMTSFGKGAKAEAAKEINDNHITNYNEIFKVNLNQERKKTDLTMTGRSGTCNIPLAGEKNQLHAKETVEKIFFGESFSDNIHIQIAYNIMDIQKILIAYTSIVACTINHMNRNMKGTAGDFLGMFKTFNDYSFTMDIMNAVELELFKRENGKFEFDMDVWRAHQNSEFRSLGAKCADYKKRQYRNRNVDWSKVVVGYLKSRNAFNQLDKIRENGENFKEYSKSIKKVSYYFGDAFTDKRGNYDEKKAFAMIRLMGMFRQSFFHCGIKNIQKNQIYNIDKNEDPELTGLLKQILENRLDSLNNNFEEKNKINLIILKDIYGIERKEDFQQLAQQYYDFSVRKVHKNMGFSIKKMRELLLGRKELRATAEKKYDSVRAKMNSLVDFLIFRFFKDNDITDSFVEKLRGALTEEEKQQYYSAYTDRFFEKNNLAVNRIIDSMKKILGNKRAADDLIMKNSLPKVKIQNTQKLGKFARAIYCLSLFLDAKEVNMLFGALIQKFENIESLFDILDSLDMPGTLQENLSLFENSGKTASELRFLQSIARMNKGKKYIKDSENKVKEIQYLDAAALFGVTDEEEVKELFHLDRKNNKKKKIDKSLRNFVINNVINNNRFVYAVRFIQPQSARKIMSSRRLVEYILKKMPSSQLERYCNTVGEQFEENDRELAIQKLATLLVQTGLENFLDVQQKTGGNPEAERKKEKYKSIVSLYLTVLYLVVKTLVRINTSYVIAFGILERDFSIYNIPSGQNPDRNKYKYDIKSEKDDKGAYLSLHLTDYFAEKGWLNERVRYLYEKNSKAFNGVTFYKYRNQVAHLNVILTFADYVDKINEDKPIKSMFDLYHFVLLENICHINYNGIEEQKKEQYLKDGENYNTMCKDFVYTMNLPFAYNTARYLNLSIRENFLKGYGKM